MVVVGPSSMVILVSFSLTIITPSSTIVRDSRLLGRVRHVAAPPACNCLAQVVGRPFAKRGQVGRSAIGDC